MTTTVHRSHEVGGPTALDAVRIEIGGPSTAPNDAERDGPGLCFQRAASGSRLSLI
jgi:hypothetical protein